MEFYTELFRETRALLPPAMNNRRTAFGTSIVIALALVLFVSLLVSWYLLRPAEVAFGVPVGVNAISITDQLSSD